MSTCEVIQLLQLSIQLYPCHLRLKLSRVYSRPTSIDCRRPTSQLVIVQHARLGPSESDFVDEKVFNYMSAGLALMMQPRKRSIGPIRSPSPLRKKAKQTNGNAISQPDTTGSKICNHNFRDCVIKAGSQMFPQNDHERVHFSICCEPQTKYHLQLNVFRDGRNIGSVK